MTGVARPGTVLCTQEVRDLAGEDFKWSSAGRHRLKGVSGTVPLSRARPPSRAGADDGKGDGKATAKATSPMVTTTALRNGVQVDYENERRVSGDTRLRDALVGEARRHDQLAPSADLHPRDALLPTLDDAAERE